MSLYSFLAVFIPFFIFFFSPTYYVLMYVCALYEKSFDLAL